MSQGALTIREAAVRLGFAPRTITRLFECEPGMLILTAPNVCTIAARSLRIPPEVFARVKARLQAH